MFDALATRAVAAELTERIVGGRVQAVLSLDELAIGLEVYAHHSRSYLLASAETSTSRIHLVSQKLRSSGEPPTPFLLLLKKHAEAAFVNRVQAVTGERIIRIEFDHFEYGVSTLIAELMGRLSNLILVDGVGTVLDAIKRVTPTMSRARTVQPGSVYLPPPPQLKADPLTLSSGKLAQILEEARGEPMWQILVQSVAGTSPLLARELVFRVAGREDAGSEPELAKPLNAELASIWRASPGPTLAYEGDKPVAVAPFRLTHLRRTEMVDSMSAALEKFFGVVEPYQPAKEPLRRMLQAARAKLERKCAALRRELISETLVERLKISGELILAHATEIKRGQKILRAEIVEGRSVQINLDPGRTPVENAQMYFSKYRHAKDAAAAVPARLEEAQADKDYADQVLADLETAENRAEIDTVVAEAREAGLIAEANDRGGRGGKGTQALAALNPRAFVSPDGFQVLVGRNARQNEQVTFHNASAQDLWLHARGVPGAHVIVITKGRLVPASTVDYAASLAAFYSQARQERWVDVAVAPRTNVRRVPGRAARPGLVTVRGERVVRVRPGQTGHSDGGQVSE